MDSRADFGAPPPPKDGQHYVKVSYPTQPVGGGMDTYNGVNKPYMDFFKDFVAEDPIPPARAALQLFVNDGDNQAAIIRGMGVPMPPRPTRAISISAMTSSGSSWKARSPTRSRASA